MKKFFIISISAVILVGIAGYYFVSRIIILCPMIARVHAPYKDLIRVESQLETTCVRGRWVTTSPLVVKGRARGNWYFEASFPIRLLDGNGKEIAVGIAQAQGEWMTTEYVRFEATLVFEAPETDTGTLVLEKDNPSGLPENADEFRIPVRFR